MFWRQGEERAPPMVRRCIDSWRRRNPGFEVVVLDETTAPERLDAATRACLDPQLSVQVFSNLLRTNLLRLYGGVWVDATCVCRTPLADWLPAAMPRGFFAFARPAPDKPLSNWFLAAEPSNYLLERWSETYNAYWHGRADRRLLSNRRVRYDPLLWPLRRRPSRWLSPWLQRNWNVYPYFVHHYTFAYLLERDAHFRALWEATAAPSADGPHLAKRLGLEAPLTPERACRLDETPAPLFKLDWRVDPAHLDGDTVLASLFEAR